MTQRNNSKFCTECGAIVDPLDNFCENCGNNVNKLSRGPLQNADEHESQRLKVSKHIPQKQTKAWDLIKIILLILIVIIFGLVMLNVISNGNSKSQPSSLSGDTSLKEISYDNYNNKNWFKSFSEWIPFYEVVSPVVPGWRKNCNDVAAEMKGSQFASNGAGTELEVIYISDIEQISRELFLHQLECYGKAKLSDDSIAEISMSYQVSLFSDDYLTNKLRLKLLSRKSLGGLFVISSEIKLEVPGCTLLAEYTKDLDFGNGIKITSYEPTSIYQIENTKENSKITCRGLANLSNNNYGSEFEWPILMWYEKDAVGTSWVVAEKYEGPVSLSNSSHTESTASTHTTNIHTACDDMGPLDPLKGIIVSCNQSGIELQLEAPIYSTYPAEVPIEVTIKNNSNEQAKFISVYLSTTNAEGIQNLNNEPLMLYNLKSSEHYKDRMYLYHNYWNQNPITDIRLYDLHIEWESK